MPLQLIKIQVKNCHKSMQNISTGVSSCILVADPSNEPGSLELRDVSKLSVVVVALLARYSCEIDAAWPREFGITLVCGIGDIVNVLVISCVAEINPALVVLCDFKLEAGFESD